MAVARDMTYSSGYNSVRAHRPKLFDRRSVGALLAGCGVTFAWCDDEAFLPGRFTLELRPRYNRIEETNKPLLTEGVTMRTVAGWRSAPWQGMRLTIEGIYSDGIGDKRYNDDGAQNGTSPYPLLPDPRYAGLNEVHVEYTGIEALRVRAGRQIVRMDNQRWVSDNNFRQTPQLFDGVALAYTGLANTEFSASHFWHVRTTSGVDNELSLTLAHAAWNPAPDHSLAAYGYFHDQPVNGAFTGFANNSYQVAGARAEGVAWRFGAIEVPYVAEFARQRPYAGGDYRIRADYWRAGAGLGTNAWQLRYDYEVKGSNGGRYGLQMPLTDFYAFNGWTLHFFNTPRTGLRDQWITGRYSIGDFTLYGESHRFKADYGGGSLGRENDVGLTWSIIESCVLRLQHARYDPGTGTPDPAIRKTWLTFTYTY
jgi:alginate export protein